MVSQITDQKVVNELRKLAKNDECANALFSYFSGREKDSSTSKVDRLLAVVRRKDGEAFGRRELISVLKHLGEFDCGTFYTGRKGHPSRFEWSVGLRSLGSAALGGSGQIAYLESDDTLIDDDGLILIEPETSEGIRHQYKLREDFTVAFRLPADISKREADRLSMFISSLPFDQ